MVDEIASKTAKKRKGQLFTEEKAAQHRMK